MDHQEITETYAVERYLLGEMGDEERERFEEHYFDCASCFRELLTAEIFQANLRAHFTEQAGLRRWSFRALGVVAAGLLVCLLGVGAYQNLVVIPELRARVESPRAVQPLLFWNETRGEEPSLKASEEGPDLLLRIGKLPEWDFSGYRVECRCESGQQWEVSLPDSRRGEDLLLTVPRKRLETGSCSLTLYGVGAAGEERLRTKSLTID